MKLFEGLAIVYAVILLCFVVDFYTHTELYTIEQDVYSYDVQELTFRQHITQNQIGLFIGHVLLAIGVVLVRRSQFQSNTAPIIQKIT